MLLWTPSPWDGAVDSCSIIHFYGVFPLDAPCNFRGKETKEFLRAPEYSLNAAVCDRMHMGMSPLPYCGKKKYVLNLFIPFVVIIIKMKIYPS